MTTVATVAGHFPLTLVTGAGAVARNSIGIVLVGGMTIGTLFTLFVVPVGLRAHRQGPPQGKGEARGAGERPGRAGSGRRPARARRGVRVSDQPKTPGSGPVN